MTEREISRRGAEAQRAQRKQFHHGEHGEHGVVVIIKAGACGFVCVGHVCGWPAKLERYYAENTEKRCLAQSSQSTLGRQKGREEYLTQRREDAESAKHFATEGTEITERRM